jgi:long-chain acyl-CoA synthetase
MLAQFVENDAASLPADSDTVSRVPLVGPPVQHHLDPADLLGVGLKSAPDDVALLSNRRRVTWRELDDESRLLAAGYRQFGLSPGDRVASLMPNCIDLVVHYLACLRSGLVVTPLNYRYTHREIDHALDVCGASALLAHAERRTDVETSSLASELPLGVISYAGAGETARFEELVSGPEPDVERGDVAPSSPAVIFFTSGSTGPAKGVTHTHETLGALFSTAAQMLELGPEDVFLPGSSISHIAGFSFTLTSLGVGAQALVAHSFDAHELIPLLRTARPTVISMLPAALTALVRDHDLTGDDLSSLRLVRCAADKVPAELDREMMALAHKQIDEGWGMTEIGFGALTPPGRPVKEGSVGEPTPGFTLSLRDEDGVEVGTGEVGRVWVQSRSRTVGYWQAPEATAEVIQDDWLDTGDLMRFDDDGCLWFFGRKKQIIVHDGSNISPQEVENALAEHPSVALAGAVGVHHDVHGENVRAYVVIEEGHERPSSADLIVFARERIGYRAPEEVVFLEEMPLTPSGKVDRTTLKRMAEDHLDAERRH